MTIRDTSQAALYSPLGKHHLEHQMGGQLRNVPTTMTMQPVCNLSLNILLREGVQSLLWADDHWTNCLPSKAI